MKYYCIKQHDITDCGAACLATIAKQNGYQISISKIREIAGTDKQGTNAFGMIQVADPAEGIVKLKPEEFFGEVTDGNKPPKYQWSGVLILLVKSDKFVKGKETQGLFQRFIHLLLPQKKLLLHIFLASMVYTILGILGAFYYNELVDSVLPDGLMGTLTALSVGVILLNVFKVLLDAIRSHLLLYLSQKLDIALLLGYYRHVLELPMNFFGSRKVGEIVSRFNDASKVRDAISGATLTIMIDTIMAVAGAVILYMQNGKMFGMECRL